MDKENLAERELATLRKMLRLHCRAKHQAGEELCPDCEELYRHAEARLQACIFLPDKPTCGRCPVHCYREPYRSRVRQAMKYAGPRMLFKYPGAAFQHLADTLKAPSPKVRAMQRRKKSRAGSE